MTLCLRKTLCLRTLIKSPILSFKRPNSTLHHFSSDGIMNTLQEASTIYKAFKRGGPAFGGWQVRPYIPLPMLCILIWWIRCFLERTTLEPLLVQESIGFALTVNMVTSTVRVIY